MSRMSGFWIRQVVERPAACCKSCASAWLDVVQWNSADTALKVFSEATGCPCPVSIWAAERRHFPCTFRQADVYLLIVDTLAGVCNLRFSAISSASAMAASNSEISSDHLSRSASRIRFLRVARVFVDARSVFSLRGICRRMRGRHLANRLASTCSSGEAVGNTALRQNCQIA